jgi:hypothetical protein
LKELERSSDFGHYVAGIYCRSELGELL